MHWGSQPLDTRILACLLFQADRLHTVREHHAGTGWSKPLERSCVVIIGWRLSSSKRHGIEFHDNGGRSRLAPASGSSRKKNRSGVGLYTSSKGIDCRHCWMALSICLAKCCSWVAATPPVTYCQGSKASPASAPSYRLTRKTIALFHYQEACVLKLPISSKPQMAPVPYMPAIVGPLHAQPGGVE